MLVIGGALFGAGMGAWRAKKLGGKTMDLLQYAAGYGMAFTMLGLILTLIIDRSLR